MFLYSQQFMLSWISLSELSWTEPFGTKPLKKGRKNYNRLSQSTFCLNKQAIIFQLF